MKNPIQILILLSIITFAACTKDEPDNPLASDDLATNYFTIDGATLNAGALPQASAGAPVLNSVVVPGFLTPGTTVPMAFDIDAEVTSVLISVIGIDGYYEVPATALKSTQSTSSIYLKISQSFNTPGFVATIAVKTSTGAISAHADLGLAMNSSGSTNYLSYDNAVSALPASYISHNTGWDYSNVYSMALNLYTSGFTGFTSFGNGNYTLSGIGNFLRFGINSDLSNKLGVGMYNIINQSYTGNQEAAFLAGAEFYLNYNGDTDEMEKWLAINSGAIAVLNNSTEYEIIFDLIDEEGKVINGYYKGSVEYFEYAE
ncbi:MAG: hypothetical protein P1P88_04475 [Bacteroidales bacterium]|nr:hypothetical protein [Bacteroidales bacterium]